MQTHPLFQDALALASLRCAEQRPATRPVVDDLARKGHGGLAKLRLTPRLVRTERHEGTMIHRFSFLCFLLRVRPEGLSLSDYFSLPCHCPSCTNRPQGCFCGRLLNKCHRHAAHVLIQGSYQFPFYHVDEYLYPYLTY